MPSEKIDDSLKVKDSSDDNSSSGLGDALSNENNLLEFLAFNKWMFTIGDPDCYPSVPHGHFRNKTRVWPKLNPYTGRVFSGNHQEDVNSRLSKNEMRFLWTDSNFVDHCRKQVHWYSNFAPAYGFPNARLGRDVFPKW